MSSFGETPPMVNATLARSVEPTTKEVQDIMETTMFGPDKCHLEMAGCPHFQN